MAGLSVTMSWPGAPNKRTSGELQKVFQLDVMELLAVKARFADPATRPWEISLRHDIERQNVIDFGEETTSAKFLQGIIRCGL